MGKGERRGRETIDRQTDRQRIGEYCSLGLGRSVAPVARIKEARLGSKKVG